MGQRIYGLCLGYEDLNDHDQLRTDPMLAVAVNKADPLGERRRQASDRGKALAGRCTLNRLELTGAEVDEQERYKKIAMDPDRIDGWMVDAFVEAHDSAPEEIVLDLDATDDPIHGQQEGRFFHGYYRHYCYLPLYIFSGEHSAVRPVAVFQYRWGRGIGGGTGTDRRPDSAELAGGLDRHPGRLGLLPG